MLLFVFELKQKTKERLPCASLGRLPAPASLLASTVPSPPPSTFVASCCCLVVVAAVVALLPCF